MKQEEIIENNKLIAEFMGVTVSKGVLWDSRMYFNVKVSYMDETIISAEDDYRYHISYDWLMPVVEKIESLRFEVAIHSKWCNINRGTSNDLGYFGGETKLEAVYKATIHFIKWYNIQNK